MENWESWLPCIDARDKSLEATDGDSHIMTECSDPLSK